ncbi:MAG: lipoprotein [Pseudomonadota bacterium]
MTLLRNHFKPRVQTFQSKARLVLNTTLAAVFLAALAGCGNKGELFRPEASDTEAEAAQQSSGDSEDLEDGNDGDSSI